jgi:hypothetical protein
MDEPLPEDDAINAAHPARSGRHDQYAAAMRLVGAKRSKGALVNLVSWLLVRLSDSDARQRVLQERCQHLETTIRQSIPPDPLHGSDGRCICSGEGWCLFCRWAEASELANTTEDRLQELRVVIQRAKSTFDSVATALPNIAIHLPGSTESLSDLAKNASQRLRLALEQDRIMLPAREEAGDGHPSPCQTAEKR